MNLLQCFFHLNGGTYATLSVPGVGFFLHFQGMVTRRTVQKAQIYLISAHSHRSLLHTFTWIRGWYTQTKDSVNAFFTGSNRNEWFALYRDDGLINDETFVKGVRRGEFRLHPIGPSGISKGCITLYSQSDFKILASALLRTGGQQLGNYMIAHGVVQVY